MKSTCRTTSTSTTATTPRGAQVTLEQRTTCHCCGASVWNCFCFGGMYGDGRSYSCSPGNHDVREAMRKAGIEIHGD